MLAMDNPPKTKCKPNKAKIDASRPLTVLNSTLRLKLETFSEELHAEYWGDMEDTLIGPHLFLTDAQIEHLCHLMHANMLQNIDNLHNNLKLNWMPCYGESLLCLIHTILPLSFYLDKFGIVPLCFMEQLSSSRVYPSWVPRAH